MPNKGNDNNGWFAAMNQCSNQVFKTAQALSPLSAMPLTLAQQGVKDMGQLMVKLASQPTKLVEQNLRWSQDQLQVWQNAWLQAFQQDAEAVIQPEKGDRRFKDDAWQDQPVFDSLKQSYLLFGRYMKELVDECDGLDDEAKARLSFFSRQLVNAMAPSNFLATNPELLRLTLESNGQNLVKGMGLMLEDIKTSSEILNISMTPREAFVVGKDLAKTPGEVVYRNHLFELIQYHPTTEKVKRKPVLIVPPFINKYYILDLRPDNSLVNWLVGEGHTVFMISWRNPDASLAEVDFEDYVVDGVIEALKQVEAQTGEIQVNAIGYCIAGALLSTTMAYMASKRMKQRIKSATLLTTMLDFSTRGELGVFINDPVISAVEQNNEKDGFFDGRRMGTTFSLLRENSLYWNYYVSNYLKGEKPMEFDLLYWNGDGTNVTAATHSFLLRQLYLDNRLCQPGEVTVKGTAIDLGKVKTPTYFLSTKDDHIAEWKSTYQGSKLFSGDTTFVLGESGHIAGVVNPPAKGKYGFWEGGETEGSAERWQASANHHDGSWWSHWQEWLAKLDKGDKDVPAREVDSSQCLMPAPGSYVLQKLPIEG